jgi:hypothetical protein
LEGEVREVGTNMMVESEGVGKADVTAECKHGTFNSNKQYINMEHAGKDLGLGSTS